MVGHRGFLPWGGNNSGVNGNSQSRGNYSPDGSIGQDNQYDHNYPPLQSNYSSPPRNGNRNYSPKNDNQDIPNRSHALPPVNSPPFHAESPRGGNHGFRGTGGNQRGTNSPQNDYEDVSRNSYLRDNNRRQQGDISLPRGNGNQQGYSPTRYPSMRREQSRSPSTQRVDDWNDYSPPPRGGAGHRRDVRSLQLDHWENNGTNNVRFPPNGNRRYSPERLYPENQNSISIDSRGESPSLAYHHHPQQRGDNYQRYENDNHSSRGDSSGASSSSGDQIDDPSVDILYEVGYRDGELIHIYPNYSDGTFGQVGSHHNILQTAPVANVTVESLMERFVRDHNTGVALLDPHLDLELEVNSSTIDTVIRSWKDADLECTLLENIMMMGCVTPRKVQQLAIPQIQSRLNVAIHSESGSGKTMAFAIPIVNHILKMSPEEREEAASMRSILALVVVPTRELSKQIGNVFSVLCQNTNIRVSISYGGLNSMGELSEGCDILVGTSQKMFFDIENLNLSHLEFFVIDEADLIFNDVIKNRQTGKYYPCIFDHKKLANNSKHQTIVSSSIRIPSSQYSESILDKSITFTHVRISRGQLSPRLNLIFNETNLRKYYGSKKQMLNETLYRRYGGQKTLVFFNSFQKCNEVYKTFSQKNWMAMFQSGDDQERRERILEEFRTGRISVLFTTDILSRGIDIIGVSIVIIYELPPFESKENFINRCGRVGRITSGDVHVFVGKPKEEKEIVGEIVQMVKDQGKADTIPVWVQNFGVQQQQDANPDSSKSSDSNSNATAFKPPAIVSDSSLSNQTKVPIVPTQTTNGPELIEDQSLLHQVAVVATPPPAHTETKRNVTKNPIAASNTSDFEKLSCIDKTPTESNQEDALNVSTSSQFVATPIAVAPNTTVSNQHSSSLEISGSEQLPRCDKTPTVTNPVGATANVLSQNLTAPNNSTITLDTPGLKQLSPVDKPNGKTVGAETNGVQPNGSFIEVLLVYFYSFFTFFSNFFTDQRADENVADHVENIGNHRAVSNNNGKSGTSRAAAGVNEVKAKKRMLKKLAREAKRGSRSSHNVVDSMDAEMEVDVHDDSSGDSREQLTSLLSKIREQISRLEEVKSQMGNEEKWRQILRNKAEEQKEIETIIDIEGQEVERKRQNFETARRERRNARDIRKKERQRIDIEMKNLCEVQSKNNWLLRTAETQIVNRVNPKSHLIDPTTRFTGVVIRGRVPFNKNSRQSIKFEEVYCADLGRLKCVSPIKKKTMERGLFYSFTLKWQGRDLRPAPMHYEIADFEQLLTPTNYFVFPVRDVSWLSDSKEWSVLMRWERIQTNTRFGVVALHPMFNKIHLQGSRYEELKEEYEEPGLLQEDVYLKCRVALVYNHVKIYEEDMNAPLFEITKIEMKFY